MTDQLVKWSEVVHAHVVTLIKVGYSTSMTTENWVIMLDNLHHGPVEDEPDIGALVEYMTRTKPHGNAFSYSVFSSAQGRKGVCVLVDYRLPGPLHRPPMTIERIKAIRKKRRAKTSKPTAALKPRKR